MPGHSKYSGTLSAASSCPSAEWTGLIQTRPRKGTQNQVRGQSRRGGTEEELRGSRSVEQSEEGVQEWSARKGGGGERGTDGCGVTLLLFFCWAGLRRSWGLAGQEGSCQQWVLGTAQVLPPDEFHLSHQLGDC